MKRSPNPTENAIKQREWRALHPDKQPMYNKRRSARKRGEEVESIFTPITRNCAACGEDYLVGGRGNANHKSRFCSLVCQRRSRYRSGRKALELGVVDAAYIAGFVDGEGCIFAYMRRDVIALRLHIVNTKRDVLDWIREVTGVGNVTRWATSSPKHANRYDWIANAEAAGSVLAQILPYLRVKAAQADLALDILARLSDPAFKADRSWQRAKRDAMKAMNARGPRLEVAS